MDAEELSRTKVPRIVRPDRSRNVIVRGGPTDGWRDSYHHLLTLSWPAFIGVVAAVYLGVNLLFATLYWLDPNGLANARPRSFFDAFNFSVETLGTIGYGVISPRGPYANGLVTVEAFTSIALTAVLTGLIFARISRPTARVLFSEIALITDFDGRRSLMFRAANQRGNQILEADVSATLARQVVTPEGVAIRRFDELAMRRGRSPLFALTWSIVHVIDEASPLHGKSPQDLQAMQAEIIVLISGLDPTFAQRVHARHSYLPEEIVWDRHFQDVLYPAEDGTGRWIVDYTRFHDVRPETPRSEPK